MCIFVLLASLCTIQRYGHRGIGGFFDLEVVVERGWGWGFTSLQTLVDEAYLVRLVQILHTPMKHFFFNNVLKPVKSY